MEKIINLAKRIEKQLPMQLVEFMESAGLVAANLGLRLYLVGGTVRDLLLERPNFDLDLVVEGDALALGRQLAETRKARITEHHRFGTVKLIWQNWNIDIVTARKEKYARPGALPEPEPGMLADDLFRRDFTVNAMAVELFSGRWGQLVDLYGGQEDLKQKTIRILHQKSFTDDATRIWRAIRYEQRLDFSIESGTLGLLRRDVPMLDTISGSRIRHELEAVLKEAEPEKIIYRASGLGVLAKLDPKLKGDARLAAWFTAARELTRPEPPSITLYLSLLCHPLPSENVQRLSSFLSLSKRSAVVLRQSASLKAKAGSLAGGKLNQNRIYSLLSDYPEEAIKANLIASDSPTVQKHISLFLDKLRYVLPSLGGDDLVKLGIPPGPRVKKILHRLLRARLEGKVRSKNDELEIVKRLSQS